MSERSVGVLDVARVAAGPTARHSTSWSGTRDRALASACTESSWDAEIVELVGEQVTVAVHRDGHRCVAEVMLDRLRVHALADQQARARVSQVVDPRRARELRDLERRPPHATAEVRDTERSAPRSGEQQSVGRGPTVSRCVAELLDQEAGYPGLADAVGLGLAEDHPTVHVSRATRRRSGGRRRGRTGADGARPPRPNGDRRRRARGSAVGNGAGTASASRSTSSAVRHAISVRTAGAASRRRSGCGSSSPQSIAEVSIWESKPVALLDPRGAEAFGVHLGDPPTDRESFDRVEG